jgi:hypothetical protein
MIYEYIIFLLNQDVIIRINRVHDTKYNNIIKHLHLMITFFYIFLICVYNLFLLIKICVYNWYIYTGSKILLNQ